MPVRVVQVFRDGVATQWGAVSRPRPFLERVAVVAVSVALLLMALMVLVVVAAVAIPVALVLVGSAWVRARLPGGRGVGLTGRRVDGRRNVRVRLPGSGGESVTSAR
jgi:hypothetical protein